MTDTTADAVLVLPEDVDKKNDERAEWARAALDAYCAATRNGTDLSDHEPSEVIGDFLNDLLHLLDRVAVEDGIEGIEQGDVEDPARPGVVDGRVVFDLIRTTGHYEAETGRAPY